MEPAVPPTAASSVTSRGNNACISPAISETEADGYRWQIEDPAQNDRWIDISGAYTEYLWVTHALVGSMLGGDGSAKLRCKLTFAGVDEYTDELKVVVSESVDSALVYGDGTSQISFDSANKFLANESDGSVCTIVINYLFDNNAIAFEPYGASVAKGSDFKTTVNSPTVVGYAPFRRVREVTLEYNDGSNRIVYDNSRESGKWLDGNAVVDNLFY
jgi:hypothetical protein